MATNKKIENKHYVKLISVLSTIEKNGISNAEELKCSSNIVLWNEFWYATKNFINYFALQSKTSINKKGEILPGNKEKVKTLINRTYKEEEDIQADILLHIMSKTSHILAQSPVTKQVSYMYRCINNKLYDYIRALPAEDTLSLDTPYKSDSMEDGAVLGDIIGDDTFNPERMYLEQKSVEELEKILKAKKAKEAADKRERFLDDLRKLNNKPSHIFIHTACVHLGLKPRTISEKIISKGLEETYDEVLFEAAKLYHVSLDEVRSILLEEKHLNPNHFKIDANDPSITCDKIYNIKNRCKNIIEDHNKTK